jgi:polysaccharide pyruvyl transferase WcaK-like protein
MIRLSGRRSIARPSSGAIAVWGHFHGRNLGDELVVAVIIDAIRRRLPDAQVITVSMSPEDAQRRHGLPALPINTAPIAAESAGSTPPAPVTAPRALPRRIARKIPGATGLPVLLVTFQRVLREVPFVIRSRRALHDVDTIVVAGSGQLLDAWHGPWEHPYTTFRWALLARLQGKETVYPSIGAGPIDHWLSAFLIRRSVRWAGFISVRDEHSVDVLRSAGVSRELPFCPDMGWAFDPGELRVGSSDDTAPRVGVNAMPHEDPRYWPRGDAERYADYLDKMTRFIEFLAAEGCRVVLFSSQTKADRATAADLRRRLTPGAHDRIEWAVDDIETIDDLVRTVVGLDYVVAGRFHSVLLPLALGIPTLGLAYHPKTNALLEQIGRPHQCLDLDSLDAANLVAAFRALRANDTPAERAALKEQAGRLRAEVEAQFDHLFGKPSSPIIDAP